MLNGYYETPLVLVSILIAIVASYAALSLAGRVAESKGRATVAWAVGGAIAMGSGIWAMHFVGMLAFHLPIPVAFDIPLTLVSLLLPIAVSGLVLWQASQPSLGPGRLAASALLMGADVSAMHYIGMAAMRMEPGIVYDPVLSALSVLIAVLAAGLGLWIGFRLRRDPPHIWLPRIAAATALGCAIVGTHYTGMAAASFPADSVCMTPRGVHQGALALLVVLASFGVLGLALMASGFDARLEANARILAMSQATAAERQQLFERERAARDQAERLSAMKDEFLATLSHELRTPLNAILGWSGMLQRETLDAALLQRGLQAIERNAHAQGMLIEDLLDMSRIIAGTVRLDLQRVDPARVIEAALGTVHPAASAKSIALHTELDAGLDVRADAGRLQQVLWNLLANAVKFTPAGGSVRVRLLREDGGADGLTGASALIRVSDSGAGIAPDFLPYVFDRFRQQDASITRRHGGLGLGLSIARHLVALHGGTIGVESAGSGAGATFTVRLPLMPAQGSVAAAPGDPPSVATAMRGPTLADLAGIRVLLVDDAPDTLEVLALILRHRGAQVTAAAGADGVPELLERLQAAGQLPHVLVSDIGMPGTDGYVLIRRIRRHAALGAADLPAIALSAFTRPDDIDKALQAGFDDYLPKPVDAAALIAHVARLAAQRGQAAQPSDA